MPNTTRNHSPPKQARESPRQSVLRQKYQSRQQQRAPGQQIERAAWPVKPEGMGSQRFGASQATFDVVIPKEDIPNLVIRFYVGPHKPWGRHQYHQRNSPAKGPAQATRGREVYLVAPRRRRTTAQVATMAMTNTSAMGPFRRIPTAILMYPRRNQGQADLAGFTVLVWRPTKKLPAARLTASVSGMSMRPMRASEVKCRQLASTMAATQPAPARPTLRAK